MIYRRKEGDPADADRPGLGIMWDHASYGFIILTKGGYRFRVRYSRLTRILYLHGWKIDWLAKRVRE